MTTRLPAACLTILTMLCCLPCLAGENTMQNVPRWTVFEAELQSQTEYANPLWDATVRVSFTSPSGNVRTIDAFWDGGKTWRVRFAPDELGAWRWKSSCTSTDNKGLHGQTGGFACVAYRGTNPLFRHGPAKLSDDRRHFVNADGTPFFWLADTAWNGVLRSTPADWSRYLKARAKQGFTAVQFVSTQWRGGNKCLTIGKAFTNPKRPRIHPEFFQKLDAKVAAINAHGLVAAPVLLWTLTKSDPGQVLTAEGCIRVARYIVARWSAHHVVWLLGGDGHYGGRRAAKWCKVGRGVFGDRHDRLVTIHPCGQSWVAKEFRDEPWLDFVGYQSGHGTSVGNLRWLVQGPPARGWQGEPPRPVVNMEPNYEAIPSYQTRRKITDREVRRAAYWSLLVSPTAGLTYGHNSIWIWASKPEVPEGHARIGTVAPWHAGLDTPGIRSITVMKRFFDSIPWWRLQPAPDLLATQPGAKDPRRFVAAAWAADGSLAILYLPKGGTVALRLERLDPKAKASWIDPRTGKHLAAKPSGNPPTRFAAPDTRDWLLLLR